MAAWFALGIVGVILLWLGGRAFVNADPRLLARGIKYASAALCGGLAVFFLVRGRIDVAMMLGAAGAAALGYLPRGLLPFGGWFGGRGGRGSRNAGPDWHKARSGFEQPSDQAGGGQQSQVETAWLRMRLNHATGRMHGEVLQGRFAGRSLTSLSFEDLLLLLRDCRAADNQGAALLESYLDRTIGEDWREKAARGDAGESAEGVPGGGALTREQALDILGLQPGATPADIRAAHRRLMKKFHPDQGGSTYLAAQINRAKDLLLAE
ncbi:DnaJ domain-containing protein [Ferrovibrio sp.]|uniref:DnaJ domain-containing protein n=1 Tax=Ferrovibrio sp. TaxID=1917215 RepID=UPI0035AF9210